MRVASFKDVMGGYDSAEVLCLYKGDVVRTLTAKDGMVHMACPNGDSIDVSEDTPVVYEPWMLDRGSLVFNGNLKLCTEGDHVRYPDGNEDCVVPMR